VSDNNKKIISELKEVINDLSVQNALLKQQLEWFKRQTFGGGKSEKTDANQLDLELLKKKENEPENEKGDELLNINYQRKKESKNRRSREECFEDLPVGEEVILIPEEVKADPDKYVQISEASSFEVEVTPPVFFKRVIIRKKFKHIENRELPPVIAPAPERLLDGSYISVNLITYIIISKFIDHLPLYRQEQIYLRYGLKLSRKLMSEWIGKIAVDWLKPIYSYMLEELRKCSYVQIDETLTRYINGKERVGKTRQGYFWVVSRPGSDVVFLWSTNRCYENVIDLLGEDFKGTKEESPMLCRWLLRLTNVLFANERVYEKKSLNEVEIECRRQSESAMTIKMIKRILDYCRDRVLPEAKFGKAVNYTLNQWPQLLEYLNNGAVQLSNNLVENAIRPIAVGRKNWLFIGHQDAGENSAILYSLLGSCKRHGIDPAEYLRDTLNKMLNTKVRDNDFYARLTPEAYKTRQAQVAA
jgi:transposase